VSNCKSFLVTEAERKHVRRRADLVAVACFLPGRAKDLSAPLKGTQNKIRVWLDMSDIPSFYLPLTK
jgi:hypothetical protein